MNELIPVNFDDQRVLTTEQLAEVYETTPRRITENYNRNKDKFTDGIHYYLLQGEALQAFKSQYAKSVSVNKHAAILYLWTERGANRHCKILDTDKAWEQFDNLEETYFRVRENQIALSGLSPELQAIFVHDQKIQLVEGRVDRLENTMTVDYGQQRTLKAIGAKSAFAAMGGKESPAYKSIGKKVFSALWRDYKDFFNINSYANTPVARYSEAIHYLKRWMPDTNLNLEIRQANQEAV